MWIKKGWPCRYCEQRLRERYSGGIGAAHVWCPGVKGNGHYVDAVQMMPGGLCRAHAPSEPPRTLFSVGVRDSGLGTDRNALKGTAGGGVDEPTRAAPALESPRRMVVPSRKAHYGEMLAKAKEIGDRLAAQRAAEETARDKRTQRQRRADQFLLDNLTPGVPRKGVEMEKLAREKELNHDDMDHARDRLGVIAFKVGFRPSVWFWVLPGEHAPDRALFPKSEDATDSPFGQPLSTARASAESPADGRPEERRS